MGDTIGFAETRLEARFRLLPELKYQVEKRNLMTPMPLPAMAAIAYALVAADSEAIGVHEHPEAFAAYREKVDADNEAIRAYAAKAKAAYAAKAKGGGMSDEDRRRWLP
jgi:hypothetical protein